MDSFNTIDELSDNLTLQLTQAIEQNSATNIDNYQSLNNYQSLQSNEDESIDDLLNEIGLVVQRKGGY